MGERDIDERLSRLEERFARIEARLGIGPSEPAPSIPQPLTQAAPSVVPAAGPSSPATPVNLPRALATPAAQPPPLHGGKGRDVLASAVAKPPAIRAGAFETQIGLKWAAWAGAIIVVIGAALGIKYAYDKRWFEALPAAARLGLLSLGGFALLGGGEVVYRRVGALASAGLFGAGVATLFVVSFAGHEYFDLYERDAAFALMGVVTLLGAGVAMRANLVSIGVLSIVGGNVAPLILGDDSHRVVPLLAYLLALQLVSLALAWWGRQPKWWTLRGVSFATICLWMILPLLNVDQLADANATTVVAFALIYAALFHAELVLSSLRASKPAGTRQPGFTIPLPLGVRDVLEDRRGIGVTFGILVTAAATIAVLSLVWDRAPIVRGAWTIALGACCLAVGVAMPRLGRKRSSIASPSPVPAVAAGYRIQAAALLVVAVPVTLTGVWVTIAWAVLALTFAAAGATLNLGVSRVAAVVVWLLAVGNLAVWTLAASIGGGGVTPGGPMVAWATILGVALPAYFVLAGLMSVTAHIVAAVIREDWSVASAARQALADAVAAGQSETALVPTVAPAEEAEASSTVTPASTINLDYERRVRPKTRPVASSGFRGLASTTDAFAVIVFVTAVFAALPSLGVTTALLAYGWLLVGAGVVVRSPALQPAGLLLIGMSAGKWLFADTLDQLLIGPAASPTYRLVFNAIAALGVALFASGLALLRVPLRPATRRGRRPNAVRTASGFAAVLIALWLVTMEISRWYAVRIDAARGTPAADDYLHAAKVAVSVFWSVYAIGCVALGFVVRVAGLRYFGLALFALTVLKVVFADLSTVQTGYRILSFLGLGLLLLGTSVLYGKLSPILLRDEPLSPHADEQTAAK